MEGSIFFSQPFTLSHFLFWGLSLIPGLGSPPMGPVVGPLPWPASAPPAALVQGIMAHGTQVPQLPGGRSPICPPHPCNLLCLSAGGQKAGALVLGLGVAVPPDPHPRGDSGGTRPQPLRHATVCEQPGSRIQLQRGWAGSDGAVGGQDGCGDWRQSTGGGVCGGNQRAAALPSPPRHLAGGGARRPLLPPLPALGTGGPGPGRLLPLCSGFLSLFDWAWECPSRTRTWRVQFGGEIGFILAPVRPPPPTSILRTLHSGWLFPREAVRWGHCYPRSQRRGIWGWGCVLPPVRPLHAGKGLWNPKTRFKV